RTEKYQHKEGKLGQYDALTPANIKEYDSKWVKTSEGELLQVNLFSKLLLLAAVKTATIAPFGLGIEMEAGKPGWNDALNGLPGMFGAGTSELYELQRLLCMLMTIPASPDQTVVLPEETGAFLTGLARCIRDEGADEADEGNERAPDGSCKRDLVFRADSAHDYWDKISVLRERYRKKIKGGISGEKMVLPVSEAQELIQVYLERVDQALADVDKFKQDGLVPTYFYFGAKRDPDDVISFTPYAVTPFLEGVVKKLKRSSSKEEAISIYNSVRRSDLFDEKLGMYKTSMSISNEPIELGRAKFFTPGWLENESVFMHMEYKYLLELLKKGLYEQFYHDIQTALVPFMDPAVYGRSILENSSFIASSANPDESLHGKGFVARLTGATVECLHMWWMMFTGGEVFTFDEQNDVLTFHLKPKLADWFFKDDDTVSFTLFSHIQVIYYNHGGKNCYGPDGVQPGCYTIVYKNGNSVIVKDPIIKGEIAHDIRSGRVERMYVELQ